ncbi:hypothetical protein D9M68_416660 [compost metagenome]
MRMAATVWILPVLSQPWALAERAIVPDTHSLKLAMLRHLTITMFAMATNAASQTIYQCRSAVGHVTLQDAPCHHDAKTEVVRKSIGQRNAEYRAEPSSFLDPKGQERIASGIWCPSLRKSYQAAVTRSEQAMLTHNSAQIQQASEAVQRAGAQISKYRCE